MVKAIISISEEANKILNILKAKYGLNDKSEAINLMAQQYEEEILEPELRPEYIKKIEEIKGQKAIYVGDMEGFRKRYSLDVSSKGKARDR